MRASDADRERVAKILHDAMAEGRLTVAELDDRLRTVYAAKTFGELVPVTSDLPVPGPLPVTAPRGDHIARLGGTPTGSTSIAIMSGADRKGSWVVPARYNAVAIMGAVDLDLTQARFTTRETVITVFAFWGGVDIVVPDDVDVRVDGVGIVGAFDNRVRDNSAPEGSPVVRIAGVAIMAGVDIRRPKRTRRDQVEP